MCYYNVFVITTLTDKNYNLNLNKFFMPSVSLLHNRIPSKQEQLKRKEIDEMWMFAL